MCACVCGWHICSFQHVHFRWRTQRDKAVHAENKAWEACAIPSTFGEASVRLRAEIIGGTCNASESHERRTRNYGGGVDRNGAFALHDILLRLAILFSEKFIRFISYHIASAKDRHPEAVSYLAVLYNIQRRAAVSRCGACPKLISFADAPGVQRYRTEFWLCPCCIAMCNAGNPDSASVFLFFTAWECI